ncbi:MAG: hypothetical protein R2734_10620 [Nocardioides sp.]
MMARIVETDADTSYSVAWIDTAARGGSMGRSVLTAGARPALRPFRAAARHPQVLPGEPRLAAPPVVPPRLVSGPTVQAFNELWYRKAPRRHTRKLQTVGAFHPLDGVRDWNRLYGRAGLVQYRIRPA